ncbi:allophanate hydrolase [Variovorax sp. WS11]|uniref:5-oxoprolinase subunit C family protein n=1 Tax=Variovorax sp. WS11 TaxID=1105204 RepID=UPI000D0D5E95|nr:biotin-dependent carboxyltransferase family protein [Variovorax sp. WS11]NDZ18221.1 biotin-dependent carboxyltransferase [Variovorax sp. WS11]PSL84229.1 allophanate hydrolase [Variovorax sp. WS11]
MIEILSNGALNLVQDLGRSAHLGLGVSGAGAMDGPALSIANWMVGNDASAAGIEISIFPFKLKFHEAACFACTGAVATLELRERKHPSWWAAQAMAGDVLMIAPPSQGARVYLAIAGGIDVPPVLGSRSTDLKSGFGGLEGRGLRKADRLALGAAGGRGNAPSFGIAPPSRLHFVDEMTAGTVRIRVLASAEYEHFSEDARSAFQRTEYRLTPDCNRQGYRLDGEALKTRHPLELLSHGIVPGTVQVPPSGMPIVQMAEANTCGGYPKIANVIDPDLWRLAQLRPGQRVRFELVDHEAAVAVIREQDREQDRIRQGLALMAHRP